MPAYHIIYRRRLDIDSEEELAVKDLIEMAREARDDESGLWSVQVDDTGRWFSL